MAAEVCVVGAGVMGLSAAVCIQEKIPGVKVTIIADVFTPNTVSDGSGGFWEPFLVEPSETRVQRWGSETFKYLFGLTRSEDAGEIGIHLVSGYNFLRDGADDNPPWKNDVIGFRKLTERELKLHPTAKSGIFYTTIQMDVKMYLPWLTKKFVSNGGKTEIRKLKSLSEIGNNFDVVVNCSGLGSYALIQDKSMVPIRGQVLKVQAPWVKHFYVDFDPSAEHREIYIFPGVNSITLGGTGQVHDWNTTVREQDKQRILEDCCKLVPSLKKAKVLQDWVGLRPLREPIRLEMEQMSLGNRSVTVVHNYGHSGSGITLHWGCAMDSTELVKKCLRQKGKLASSRL